MQVAEQTDTPPLFLDAGEDGPIERTGNENAYCGEKLLCLFIWLRVCKKLETGQKI